MQNRFLIIVTGYSCSDYVLSCFQSLLNQSYNNWIAVFISDGSTDDTADVVNGIDHPRVCTETYSTNDGAAKRRFDAIRKYGDQNDIVLLLGMDDELMPNALEVINKQYEAGAWMTYGNYRMRVQRNFRKGKVIKHKVIVPMTLETLRFPDFVHQDRSYRKHKYRSTAPNTFRKFLFNRMTPHDFIVDVPDPCNPELKSHWARATTESTLMFSLLEMCGKERIGIVTEPIYYYRTRSDNARSRFSPEYQEKVYNDFIKRPKKELYEPIPA